jgi:hypothetical protein
MKDVGGVNWSLEANGEAVNRRRLMLERGFTTAPLLYQVFSRLTQRRRYKAYLSDVPFLSGDHPSIAESFAVKIPSQSH